MSNAIRSRVALVVICALLVSVTGMLLNQTGYMRWLDGAYMDTWFQLDGVKKTPTNVVIASIDDRSFAQFPSEPLTFWAPHMAKASQTLRAVGASVVGMDIIFAGSPSDWMHRFVGNESPAARRYNAGFQAELQRGHIVMVAARYSGFREPYDSLVLPNEDYLFALPKLDFVNHIGLGNLAEDDSVVRRMSVATKLNLAADASGKADRTTELPSLSMAALLAIRSVGGTAVNGPWSLGGRSVSKDDPSMWIAYAGPPGTVTRVSFADLVKDNATNDPIVQSLRGKVVILANEDGGDRHITPYARPILGLPAQLMSGAEIHANIVEMLLSGERVVDASPWGVAGLYALLGVLLALGMMRAFWGWQLLAVLVSLAFAILAARFAFAEHVVLPIASGQVAIVLMAFALFAYRLFRADRSRDHLRKLFGQYVSDGVVDEILRSGQKPGTAGEQLQVSVIFADMWASSTIAEGLPPKEMVVMLNTFLGEASTIIDRHGGMLSKFTGDGFMAVFGAPVLLPDHANRAIEASVEIVGAAVRVAAKFDADLAKRALPPFRIGLGVHTGEALVGSIGSAQRSEYTAIGDTVNISARLEALTRQLKRPCVISRECWSAAKRSTSEIEWQQVPIKGRNVGMEVTFLGNYP
jgi:adenylate cyclase